MINFNRPGTKAKKIKGSRDVTNGKRLKGTGKTITAKRNGSKTENG